MIAAWPLPPGSQKLPKSLACQRFAVAAAWSKQHDFVASTIVGANSVEQLDQILLADGLVLSDELLARIDAITHEHPYPMG